MSNKLIEALEMLLADAKEQEARKPKPTLHGTGQYFFTDPCPTCNGKGRVTPLKQDTGWRIDYHFQDGHETSNPMTKEEAISRMTSERNDRSCNLTLIGPDGQIYLVRNDG